MKTNTRSVVEPWMRNTPPPEGGGVCNIGLLVLCHNPLWTGRKIGTAAAASWAVIWPDGNKKTKRPAGLWSLSPPCIWFVRRTLTLTTKEVRRIFDTWMWDAPPPDGNTWVRQIRRVWKGLLQSLIRWGGGDRRMGDQSRECGFGGQGLIIFQITLWAVQGRFVQEG